MREIERERERQTDRQTDKQTEMGVWRDSRRTAGSTEPFFLLGQHTLFGHVCVYVIVPCTCVCVSDPRPLLPVTSSTHVTWFICAGVDATRNSHTTEPH